MRRRHSAADAHDDGREARLRSGTEPPVRDVEAWRDRSAEVAVEATARLGEVAVGAEGLVLDVDAVDGDL